MKVSELIEKLKEFPQDMEVIKFYDDIEYGHTYEKIGCPYTLMLKRTGDSYDTGQVYQYIKPLPYDDETVLIIS